MIVLQTDGVAEWERDSLLQASEGRMEHYAGIDVSLDTVSVCIVDGTGKVLRKAKLNLNTTP